MDVTSIRPELMVHAKGEGEMNNVSGEHVGTVDHLEGDQYIKLKKNDSTDGQHHWIPVNLVDHVDDQAVYLNIDKKEFYKELLNENPMAS